MLSDDPWLSGILGQPARHYAQPFDSASRLHWPGDSAFVWAKIPVEDRQAARHLCAMQFEPIEIQVQLARPAVPEVMTQEALDVRFAHAGDEDEVCALARTSFVYDRFHRDPRISDPIASRIKEQWAGNFFRGQRGDWMIVIGDGERLAGFLQVLHAADGDLVIDLIAIAQSMRGRGYGQRMIRFAAQRCLGYPAGMRVGTQLINLPSLALYTKMGFRITDSRQVWHWHSEERSA
jgi:ribosomal protein S18 acetylase RimI-like enzyme